MRQPYCCRKRNREGTLSDSVVPSLSFIYQLTSERVSKLTADELTSKYHLMKAATI